MEPAEYRMLAAVEDQMWYFRALHGHVERLLTAALRNPSSGAAGEAARDPEAAEVELLDAGCGTGGLIRRLRGRRLGWRWAAVDVSPLACALARERVGDVPVIEASLTRLPFPDARFGGAVTADVLYHIDDDTRALAELARVLRPGGVLVVNVPAYPWLWSYHDVAVHAVRRYRRRELAAKLRAAGFADVRTTHWNALLLPLVVVRRKLLPARVGASDVQAFPGALERGFGALMAAEARWLRSGRSLAFGSSILAVARKSA